MNGRYPRTRLLLAGAVAVSFMTGCAASEDNPLNVNAGAPLSEETSSTPEESGASGTAGSAGSASFLSESLGDDPLNVGADGAKLCGVQPQDSFQQYTIMLHNPTLQEFTLGEMTLGNSEGLRQVKAEVTPANREGHGNHGAAPAAAGAHGGGHETAPTPTPTESEPSTFLVAPVPADGYTFEPDKHINIVVSVALEDGVDRGTAENIVVNFSSPARDFSVSHNLEITIDRTSCA